MGLILTTGGLCDEASFTNSGLVFFCCFLSFSISVGMPSPFFIIHHQCLLWLVLFLLYFFWNQGRISYIYILIYVDDIIVTGNSSSAMKHLWHTLHQQFSIKDLGQLHFWVLRSPLLVQVSFLLNSTWEIYLRRQTCSQPNLWTLHLKQIFSYPGFP